MKSILQKKIALVFVCLSVWLLNEVYAQNEVAIGSSTTKSNAILWLNGNGSQGLILPVVTNKSAVSNPDKGMIVYDDSDNKVWYRSNTAWVEIGGSGGGSTSNLNLLLQGNTLQLRDGTTVLGTPVTIGSGTQANGSFLVFTGGTWQFATLTGDVTGANGAIQVNGIKGKSITTLPASAQALVYDPAANAGNGGWVFQAFSGGGGITSISGTAPVTVTNPTTTPVISLANAGITNALLAADAVTSAKILDGTITGADIAPTTITADKIAQSAATTGQVLKWNGTNWVPQNDDTGTGAVPTLKNGEILIGDGTTNTAAILSGDASLTGGALTIAANAITTAKINANAVDATKLASDAVTSAKILDGTIADADISGTAAIAVSKLAPGTNGQVLTTTGGVPTWQVQAVPTSDLNGLTDVTIATPAGAQLLINDGAGQFKNVNVSGDASISTVGALTISNGAISGGTGGKILDASITSADLANGSVSGGTGGVITDGTVTDADISATAAIAGSKVTPAFGTQNISTTGTLSAGATTVTGLTIGTSAWPASAGGVLTNDGTGILSWAPGSLPSGTTGQTLRHDGSSFIATSNLLNNGTTVTIDGNNNAAGTMLSVRNTSASQYSELSIDGNAITGGYLSLKSGGVQKGFLFNLTNEVWLGSESGAGPLKLFTNGVEKMRINAAGNVGIGTATPTAKLEVVSGGPGFRHTDGTVSVESQIAGTDAWFGTASANHNFHLLSGGFDQMVLRADNGFVGFGRNPVNQKLEVEGGAFFNGNVGIGTATPSANLEVAGQIKITGGTPGLNKVLTSDAAGLASWATPSGSFSTLNTIPKGDGTTLVASNIFDDGTNVGIGTTSPGTKLDVSAPSPTITLNSTSGVSTSAASALEFRNAINGLIGSISDTGSSDHLQISSFVQGIFFNTNFTTQMELNPLGNLGIGIAPSERLHVNGNIRFSGALMPNNSAGTVGQVLTSAGPGAAPTWSSASSGWSLTGNAGTNPATNFVGTVDAQDLTFATAGVERARIETTGDFGIGTADPTSKLDVAGDINFSTGSTIKYGGNTIISLPAGTGGDNMVIGKNPPASLAGGQGFNVIVGERALNAGTTTARANVAIGYNAMQKSTTGIDQVAVGTNAMVENVTGTNNTAIGTGTLRAIVNGSDNNTALGFHAGELFTSGTFNTFLGEGTDASNGLTNATAIGSKAIVTTSNTIQLGSSAVTTVNVGTGTTAKLVAGGLQITGGTLASGNVLTSDASGNATWQPAGAGTGWTLLGNGGTADATNFIGTTDGIPFNIRVNNQKSGRIDHLLDNTFFGYRSGRVTTGISNTAYGSLSLEANVAGLENTAVGLKALQSNTSGSLNTAVGKSALFSMSFNNGGVQFGSANTAVGYHSLYNTNPTNSSNGARNTAIGYFSGAANTTGTNNVFIGYSANTSDGTITNATAIGHNAMVTASNMIRLGDANVTVIQGQVNFTASSDRRSKRDIIEIDYGLDFIKKLKPVSYRMNNSDGRYHWGFIAQDIESLVGTDHAVLTIGQDSLRSLGLRYTDFIAPMVKAMQEQQLEIEDLKLQLQQKKESVSTLESSVSALMEEMEKIKQLLAMEANLKSKN